MAENDDDWNPPLGWISTVCEKVEPIDEEKRTDHTLGDSKPCTCGDLSCKAMVVERCPDCGNRPIHRDSHVGLCRNDTIRAGYPGDFRITINRERLRALVGEEMAARIETEACDDDY